MKKIKASPNAHTADTKYGMGDYYGMGIKQKVGTLRDDYINMPSKPKTMGKPPKSLA